MPSPCHFGVTETGPSPNHPKLPSDMETGDTATFPTMVPSISATKEMVRALASRNPARMNCSLWSVCGAFRNADSVTASIAGTSSSASRRMIGVLMLMSIGRNGCFWPKSISPVCSKMHSRWSNSRSRRYRNSSRVLRIVSGVNHLLSLRHNWMAHA